MIVVFGVWLIVFQNSVDLAQFSNPGVLGDLLLILGVLVCFVSGILIQKKS
jgi:hypothetical protein